MLLSWFKSLPQSLGPAPEGPLQQAATLWGLFSQYKTVRFKNGPRFAGEYFPYHALEIND